jgi:integrase
MAELLYGNGLRVKDIDFETSRITIRDGKGEKDRITILPEGLIPALKDCLACLIQQHEQDF